MKRILFFATVALALSGCGSGGNGGDSASAGNDTELATDSFTAKVLAIAAMTSDTSDADSVDAISETAPEDTQPTPLI